MRSKLQITKWNRRRSVEEEVRLWQWLTDCVSCHVADTKVTPSHTIWPSSRFIGNLRTIYTLKTRPKALQNKAKGFAEQGHRFYFSVGQSREQIPVRIRLQTEIIVDRLSSSLTIAQICHHQKKNCQRLPAVARSSLYTNIDSISSKEFQAQSRWNNNLRYQTYYELSQAHIQATKIFFFTSNGWMVGKEWRVVKEKKYWRQPVLSCRTLIQTCDNKTSQT